MTGLIRTISALSLREKAELNKAITMMIASEGAEAQLVEDLKKRICDIMGIQSMDVHKRTAENMIAKVLLSNALLGMGKSEVAVGYTLGFDNSTINYHRRMMETWRQLPGIYTRELGYWNKLKEQI